MKHNTPRLAKGYTANFKTMLRAAKNGDLLLISCLDAATKEPRAVIAATYWNTDGKIAIVPFGHLCPGNPYEEYIFPV